MAPADARSIGPVAWYYLATPVFFILDWLWGISVRVTALDGRPDLKYLYYALCLGCGAVTAFRPRLEHVVGLAESAVNVALVVTAIPIAYMGILQSVLDDKPMTNPFTPTFFVNLALSAAVAYTAFYRHERALYVGRRES